MKKAIKKGWKYVLLIIWLVLMIGSISQTAKAFSNNNYDLGGDMLIVSMLWFYVLISKLNEYESNKLIMNQKETIANQSLTIDEMVKSRDRVSKFIEEALKDGEK